jgi:hypothetical protein
MRDDPICREKWRVQRKFARKAGYEPARYLDLVHEYVERWAKKNGVRLKYADVSKLTVGPLLVKESSVEYATEKETAKRARRRRVSRPRGTKS